MISRYTLPPFNQLWTERKKYEAWLKVEVAVLEALAEKGLLPLSAVEEVKQKAKIDEQRITELEKVVDHDVIAFVTQVAETVGEAGKYLHYGLTSSDVVDTSLSLLLKEATEEILKETKKLFQTIKEKALVYKSTWMVGRTHGVHAEPITFGFKLAIWSFEIARHYERLQRAKDSISYGKISGAVGTYAHLPPDIEEKVCLKLGLKPAPASSQVLQRDRMAELLTTLALLGSSLEKMAVEIRHLQRTEVLEIEEPFRKGQKGSSAMPHKKNPILCERITGLARVLRSNSLAAMENVALWHERDISHSSVERIIIPDSTTLTHYLLVKMSSVIESLKVNEGRMKANLELTRGLIYSQQVLLHLIEKGLSREKAYEIVQKAAFAVWQNQEKNLLEVLKEEEGIKGLVDWEKLSSLCSPTYYLRNLEVVFKRLEEFELSVKGD